MSFRPFRFLHAADLHLERPFEGVAEAPDALRERLIDAPYVAATRLFDLAVAEGVDFVILAGDVADIRRAGPRAMAFLVEQFERLAARNIRVYWAGGQVDPPSQWPASISLPRHVRVFPADRVESFLHERDGRPLARIVGVGGSSSYEPRAADFHPPDVDVPTIAALHLPADLPAMDREPIAYWALGGDHSRRTLFASPGTAHYAGTPQGRTRHESGPRGATLVDVDDSGRARTVFQPLDAVRWFAQTVVVEPETERPAMEKRLREEMGRLATGAADRAVLVHFTLAGGGPLSAELRRAGMRDELAGPLRDEFGHREPPVWVVDLDIEPAALFPAAFYEQDSILGDYLRALGDLQSDPSPTALAKLWPAAGPDVPPGIADSASQVYVLRRAAELGIDLLRGETPSLRAHQPQRTGTPHQEIKP
ncbi:MAG: DNA repair exonuclease [Pirellulales bacterium]